MLRPGDLYGPGADSRTGGRKSVIADPEQPRTRQFLEKFLLQ